MGLLSFLFGNKKKNAVEEEPKTAKKPEVDTHPKKVEKPENPVEPVNSEEPEKAPEPELPATVAEEPEIDDAETETVTESKPTRSGRFDIKRTKDNRFVFNLYSSNKVLIATSQIYSSAQSAKNGVKSVMANAKEAEIEDTTLKNVTTRAFPKWEIYIDKAGEYRFRLLATNGQCVTHAKAGYAHKSSCKRAIESIVRLACDADVDKSYLTK